MTLPTPQFFNNKRQSITDFALYETKFYYCKFIIVYKCGNSLNVIYTECLQNIFVKPFATNTNSLFTL